MKNTMAYIWLNYYRAKNIKPQYHINSSIYYRFQGIKYKLLDDYADLPFCIGKSEIRFVRDLLCAAMGKLGQMLTSTIYEHGHTIGGMNDVDARKREIRMLLLAAPRASP